MKLKSKAIIAGIAAVLVIFSSILIYHTIDADKSVRISYPKGYTKIDVENAYSNSDFLEPLGFEPAAFVNYMQKNDMVYFAATLDNSRQFRLVSKETDLSKDIGSLEDVPKDMILNIGKKLIKDGFKVVEVNTLPYYEITTDVVADGGQYISVQYVTIRGGKYYSLTYYGTGKILSSDERAEIEEVINSLKVPSNKSFSESFGEISKVHIFYAVLVGLLIMGGLVAIVYLSLSIWRDLSAGRNNDGGSFKIKRRK